MPDAQTAHHAPRSLLIRAARAIDPATGTDRISDIAVRDGLIESVSPASASKTAPSGFDRVINAEGLICSPGLIDPHVHLREPGGEDAETIETGTAAAVAGGFTAVCCMPNTSPAIDDDAMVEFVYTRTEQTAHCRVYPVGAATRGRKGDELAELALMARAGAVGFSDDGDCLASPALMLRALTYIQPTGLAFMQHCQEPSLTRGSAMHAGSVAARLGLGGWPRLAEELIVERDIRLLKAVAGGGKGEAPPGYHVQHLSCAGSVDLIRKARAAGLPVSAEASPHHLTLTHECVERAEPAVAEALGQAAQAGTAPASAGPRYWTLAKMNPPLRERSDVRAILEGVADGTITILATDHAPHTPERKHVEFEHAAFGITGLETALALYIKSLIEPGVIDWPRLIELLTINPARLCRLDRPTLAAMSEPKPIPGTSAWAATPQPLKHGLGTLAPSAWADLTLIDPNLEWTVDAATHASRSRNTPYHGVRLTGRAIGTLVGGVFRYRHDSLEGR
ncbi:MAG: dihydroorotase [Phycisphaeraceae bacterium]|nr:dihydroorotase [Phycisphaeraceae bacterium]